MNTNIYNPYVRRELELYHHGVRGQKWGQRNGPPYPLFAGAHSASEKKAGWRKSLNKSSSARYGGAGQSNREARKYQRKLNQLDKNQTEHFARYQRASDKAARIERKHGNTSKKYQKAIDKAAAYERSLKDSEAVTWKTIAELTDKGYSMNSEKVKRYALMGETMVGTLLGGFLGGTLVTAFNSPYLEQKGNKFNVRKTDPSEQQSTRMEIGTHDGVKATIETSTKPSNNSNVENKSEYAKQINNVKKLIDNNDIIGDSKVSELWRSDNPSDKKRVRDAADLGLKALDKMGRDAADDINNIDDYDREWFMFEDQTLGLMTVADMVNRGKSKDQVKKAIDAADSVTYDFYDDPHLSRDGSNSTIFSLQEAADGAMTYSSKYGEKKNFLDACYEVKAEQNASSNKQKSLNDARRMQASDFNRARQMLNAGRSYADIAKRLGVSESTVWTMLNDNGS